MINDIIVKIASSYLGNKEISGNQGFVDPKFETEMVKVGWSKGQAWCAYFGELVWRQAYKENAVKIDDELNRLFSASAVTTLANFKNKSKFITSKVPVKGALAIWQKHSNGIAEWQGHIGVVCDFTDSVITTIDGNTNTSGGREGIEVGKVKRRMNFGATNGLVLQGFIYPKE